MGDRTFVTLTMKTDDYRNNEHCIKDLDCYDQIHQSKETLLTTLDYYEVNFACLDFADELIKKLIPHDQAWSAGESYPSGRFYVRFNNDECVKKEFANNDHETVLLSDLIKAQKDNNISDFIKKMIEEKAVCSLESLVQK